MAITRTMTLEEFEALPEEKPALELIDGVVYQKPMPLEQHGWLQGLIATLVNSFAVPRRLAGVMSELRTRYGRDSLVPDVAVFRWSRIPRDPNGRVRNDGSAVPDIAIEIVSPDQSATFLRDKCRRFLASGVEIALVVDPQSEVVLRGTQDQGWQILRGDDRIDLDAVLPGFELTAAELFGSLDA